MTTERELQEWKNKRQKPRYKSPSSNPIFFWLLGLLAVSALLTVKAREPIHNLPTSSPSSTSITREQI
ncbi:hypothetical protein [Gloeothece verrucosa]|uniref:Uncharacterized protein n=1 Tax=Gloeothece verrucosa (strain PCC 7822) TaxID=497965 RepID=E0ULD6_GLOV7|nr:hypothetical protein [Gloeothece verrucosa]ADN17766.1 hypothetical protein Cyan7822_5912 [Gloeothece verrucosa PCC 7822]